MKVHISVDADSGLVHTVHVTAGHVNDVIEATILETRWSSVNFLGWLRGHLCDRLFGLIPVITVSRTEALPPEQKVPVKLRRDELVSSVGVRPAAAH